MIIVTHTKICFVKKGPGFLSDFQITLTTLPMSNKHQHLRFLNNEKNRIKAARDIIEIFEILEPYLNYSDYSLLKRIINEFGTSDLKKEMKEYIAQLEQFQQKTTIQDFVAATKGEVTIPEDFKIAIIKQDRDPAKCTLYEVYQFKKNIANQAALSEYALSIHKVDCSSVKIVLAYSPEAFTDLLNAFDWQFKETHNILKIEFSSWESSVGTTVKLTDKSLGEEKASSTTIASLAKPSSPVHRHSRVHVDRAWEQGSALSDVNTSLKRELSEAVNVFQKKVTETTLDLVVTEREQEISAAVSALQKKARSVQLNIVVVGKGGDGKSTLVNSLLGFKRGDKNAAEVAGKGLPTTKSVQNHQNTRNEVVVRVWDTPGLFDQSFVKQEQILAELSVNTKKKADLVLVCIKYCPGVRVDDSHKRAISIYTKVFGENFWKYALFVMTMVNCASSEMEYREEHLELLTNIKRDLKTALSDSLQQDLSMSEGDAKEIASKVPFLTAGREPGILPFENKEWNGRLFEHCLDKADSNNVPTLLQVRYGDAIWRQIVLATIGGTAVGAVGGAAVGAGVGALIGLAGGPPTIATGAWLGAAIGGIIGGGSFGTCTAKAATEERARKMEDVSVVHKAIDKMNIKGKEKKDK